LSLDTDFDFGEFFQNLIDQKDSKAVNRVFEPTGIIDIKAEIAVNVLRAFRKKLVEVFKQ